jgi:hypothetical protein
MANRKKLRPCVLCGNLGQTTKDHVPPRTAFAEPYPANLITVEACSLCNGGTSALDEEFGVFMGALAANATPAGANLWTQQRRTVERNSRIKNDLISRMNTRWSQGSDGTWRLDRHVFRLDYKKFEPLYDKAFRALHFRQFKTIYPPDRRFEFYYPRRIDPMTEQLIGGLFKRSVGGTKVFCYGIAATEEDPDLIAGALIFYQTFMVVGMTDGSFLPASGED